MNCINITAHYYYLTTENDASMLTFIISSKEKQKLQQLM